MPDFKTFKAAPQSRERLDGGGLPSETLKSGSLERGESGGGAEGVVLRLSAPLAHRSKVSLQVLSGETTPSLDKISDHNRRVTIQVQGHVKVDKNLFDKIPLNLPFTKGDFEYPPLKKGDGGIFG